jgi:diaminopimelate epimerase
MKTSPETVPFTKMQGVGNDFVVVDGRGVGGLDWSGLAREMCDRRFGIGADGLLVMDTSTRADIAMRMYNPDGTPDVCGNGLRCIARYAIERLGPGVNARSSVTISTPAGVRRADLLTGPDGARAITVEMGEPRFAPIDIPMRVPGTRVVDYPLEVEGETVTVTALSTGTTHAVVFVDALPDEETFLRLSPRIEHHPLFPDRTSLMWTQVESPSRLRLRIWERGAGETWGCGTGACAAAVAAQMHGYTDGEVTVASRGGELVIRWREGEPILMTGPAVYVYEGVYPLDPDGSAA